MRVSLYRPLATASAAPSPTGEKSHRPAGLTLSDEDRFGGSLSLLDDLDDDAATTEFAIGAPGTEGSQGAVYVFSAPQAFFTTDDSAQPTLLGTLGAALTGVFDDPDGNGLPDLLAGSPGDAANGAEAGAAYGLFFDETSIPVELAAFTAQQRGTAAVLTWTTLTETNSEGFYVEHRPPDAAAFVDLGFVSSAAPGGTATEAQPNPFRNETTLQFAVHEAQPVRLSLYDLLGRRVRTLYDGVAPAGELQTVSLRGANRAPGRYFVHLAGPSFSDVQPVTLVK